MVVFDTDIIIAALRDQDDALLKVHKYGGHAIAITCFTWFELLRGVQRAKSSEQELARLATFLDEIPIVSFETRSAAVAAEKEAHLLKIGKPTGVIDNFIAAICIAKNETLVTRNTKHFENIPGLRLETW